MVSSAQRVPLFGQLDADPDRLRSPRVRRDGELVPATWDEALAAADAGLTRVIDTYGRDAVALYLGNPSVQSLAPICTPRTLRTLLAREMSTQRPLWTKCPSTSRAATCSATRSQSRSPDIDRTDFLLILGADPQTSNGSLWTAPDLPGRLGRCSPVVGR